MNLLICFIVCFAASFAISGNPVKQVVFACIASMFFGAAALQYCFKTDRKYMSYKLYTLFHVLQPIFLLGMLQSSVFFTKQTFVNTTLFEGRFYTLYYSFMTVPACSFLFAYCVRIRGKSGPREPVASKLFDTNHKGLTLILCMGAVINSLIWFQGFFPRIVGYGIRVFRGSFAHLAILAGLMARFNPVTFLFWVSSLGLGFIMSFLTGSRGYAFYPIAFFIIGYSITLSLKWKLIFCAFLLMLLPTAFFVLGFISDLRNEVGRKSFDQVNVHEVLRAIPYIMTEARAREDAEFGEEKTAQFNGTGRLCDLTLLIVPNMSPGIVPFRGYNDYLDEIQGMFFFGGADLVSFFGKPYPSVRFANPYGFNTYGHIEDGRLKSHTVPFSVIADSWSRFGLLSAVIQVFATLFMFRFFERLNWRFNKHSSDIFLPCGYFLLGMAFSFATVYNLTRTLRQTVLYFFGIMLVCKVIHILSETLKVEERVHGA